MIVLVSLIVLLRGLPCFHDISHGASLHPHSFIFALVPHIFDGSRKRSYAHTLITCLFGKMASKLSLCIRQAEFTVVLLVDFVKRHCAWEREAVW